MAKAKNMVIAGDYKGYVINTFPSVSIVRSGKIISINSNTVKKWNIETEKKTGPGVGSVVAFGAVAFAGDKNVSIVSIEWQDGKKSLLEVDSKILRSIQVAMFEKVDKEKQEKNEKTYKKWLKISKIMLIVFVAVLFLGAILPKSDTTPSGQSSESEQIGKTYEITGGVIGDYGRKVTLNANTDMPIDRYLQKIPAGTYKVSTDQKVTTYVGIVKDATAMTGNERYPEELQYIVTQKFEPGETFELTLAEDESFLIYDGDIVTFKEVKK